jgi:transcriptional regulator with XRE-family HTH domain
MEVGQRVRAIRLQRGMPLAEMARRASISRQSAFNVERGQKVSDPVLAGVARALDIPLRDLDADAADRIAKLAEAV